MSERKDGKVGGPSGDENVSPMEAQNTGPARKGPTEKPLREERPGEPSGERAVPDTPMKPGGETSTRDDV